MLAGAALPAIAPLMQAVAGLCSRYVSGPAVEEEEESREDETMRQKEFLEKVVASQKNQLKQLEKLQKLNCVKMLRDNKVTASIVQQYMGYLASIHSYTLAPHFYARLVHIFPQILLKEIELLKKEMAEMKRFKVKLPIIKSEERKLS